MVTVLKAGATERCDPRSADPSKGQWAGRMPPAHASAPPSPSSPCSPSRAHLYLASIRGSTSFNVTTFRATSWPSPSRSASTPDASLHTAGQLEYARVQPPMPASCKSGALLHVDPEEVLAANPRTLHSSALLCGHLSQVSHRPALGVGRNRLPPTLHTRTHTTALPCPHLHSTTRRL